MFRKILIANRGEIAVRVMRSARRMGIATVAVYCDADRDAVHVELADEAINIGPPPASASYLVIERIVEACRTSGADAVHPGYGFLSERAAFPEALESAGIAFIGPNAKAIAAMGDKIESKKLAAAAGVATVPGYLGTIEDESEAFVVAREIGLPVMIKASAGGGGKGMRIARTFDGVSESWRLARSEAQSSFGDNRVFIEKFIENTRHIEVQVLGDKHGHVIYLGERECSIQRRNQKVVEEAPSSAVSEQLRAEMGGQAVALAKAVGYDSAGTVEFAFSPDGRFYFLEMNTRLQVEHPVTELVTGIDLVEQMICVAAGEPLSIRQADVCMDGWAIESRICAEDPRRDFLPSIGRLDRYRPPAEGRYGAATVRIDSGVVEGSEVSIYFDSLIAKLVTHAPDRAAATAAMAAALDRFVIDGIAHNQPFLSALMDHPRWAEGRLSTAFISDEFPDGFGAIEPAGEVVIRLAIVALAIELRRREGPKFLSGYARAKFPETSAEWVVRIADERIVLNAGGNGGAGSWLVLPPNVSEPLAVASTWHPGDPLWAGMVGTASLTVQVRPVTGGVRLSWHGVEVIARAMRPHVAALESLMPKKRADDTLKTLRVPMPGLVIALHAEAGQKVRAGQPLAIVEAMKMENVLRAERDATVARVAVKLGDVLAVDAVIMEFE